MMRTVSDPRSARLAVYRSMLSVSAAFVLVYTVFLALLALQSSMNRSGSLGVLAISLLYAGYFISVFYSPFIIETFGTKVTLLLAFLAHTVFVVSNFYPRWWSLLPATALLGLLFSPQWTAQSVIFSRLAIKYSKLTDTTLDATLAAFNGGSLAIVFLSGIPGSIIASLLLSAKKPKPSVYHMQNRSADLTVDLHSASLHKCGSNYCPFFKQWNYNSSIDSTDAVTSTSLYIVLGIYLAINLCGIFVTLVFVKNVKSDTTKSHKKVTLIKDIFRVMKSRDLICIMIIVAINGSGNSFYTAIFTNSFIACTLGVATVGYGYACYTVGRSAGCFISGVIQGWVPRVYHFAVCYCIVGALLSVCLLWTPTSDDLLIMCAMSFGFGFVVGAIETQSRAMIALLFAEKLSAAFAVRCLADGFGHAVALLYMGFLCTRLVLYIHMGTLACSVLMYAYTENRMRKSLISIEFTSTDTQTNEESHKLKNVDT